MSSNHARGKLLRAFDRDIAAEKAATMFRKGATPNEVCAALRMSETRLRELASDYGFRWPSVVNSLWPTPDDPGEPGRMPTQYDNWARAVEGARRTRLEQGL